MNLIRSISGIRGIVGKTIDTSTVELYCNAFANIQSPGKIAIARDGRDPGKNLYISAIAVSYTHLTLPTIYSV